MSDHSNSTYKAVEVVLIALHDPTGHNLIDFKPQCLQKYIPNEHYMASLTQLRFRLNATNFRLK